MATTQELVEEFFVKNEHKWKFRDGARTPTLEEVSVTLDKTRDALILSEDQTQISVGRLIVKKDQGHYDVYVHVGEL